MAMPTAALAAEKWKLNTRDKFARLKAAIGAIAEADSPMKKATTDEAFDRWKQNTLGAADQWKARTAAVTLTAWKAKFDEATMPTRWSNSITGAETEVAAFYGHLFPHIRTALTEIPERSADLEANIARSAAFIRKMAEFKKPAGI